MEIVYAEEDFPSSLSKSIFLAGPTPRSNAVSSWRPDAIRILEEQGYDGVVFLPEHSSGKTKANYINQVDWETKGLNMADCIIFWVPRDLKTLPAFTTNVEFGEWLKSGKVVFGAPANASKVGYLKVKGKERMIPQADSLAQTIGNALDFIGDGATRVGGECQVPIYIWRTATFQKWYQNQKSVGNRLDQAKVLWCHRTGPQKKQIFMWILRVNVYVSDEKRNKTNDLIIGTPDSSSVLLYKKGRSIKDTDIVLVREFRSAVSNESGFLWELPGGASHNNEDSPVSIAVHEVEEETGFKIPEKRLQLRGSRQNVGSLLTRKVNLFSAEIDETELEYFVKQRGISHGIESDLEKTCVVVCKAGEILMNNKVDWSMTGMILSVLMEEFS